MKRLAVIAVAAGMAACGGGSDGPSAPPASNARTVQYEISGTYTGALTVAYTTESNATVTVEVTSLPWTKAIVFPSSVAGIGFGGAGITGRPGAAGQTVTMRIRSAGTVVKTETVTTPSTGIIGLPTLAFVFP